LDHQKRIRKLVRQLTLSAGIHVVVWEECYWRWRSLNEIINNAINEAAASDADGSRAHVPIAQQVRFMVFYHHKAIRFKIAT
jgi:neurofibromin 1